MKTILDIILIVLGIGGFSLAFYIYKTKRANKVLACPLDGHCDTVTHSEYSKFFGVPVEVFGMLYYASVVLGYLAIAIFSSVSMPWALVAMFALTFFSFLFSAYLTFIQAFNLKQWCTWCLASAGICSFIFVTSVFSLKSGITSIPAEIFGEIHEILVEGNLLSAALGLGVSFAAAVIFFKFAKDFTISKFEADIAHVFSQITWFSIFIFVLTSFGLYFSNNVEISRQPMFFAFKMAAVFALLATSAVFNLLLAPRLIKKSIKNQAEAEESGKAFSSSEARTSIVFNYLSVISWAIVFLLASMFKF